MPSCDPGYGGRARRRARLDPAQLAPQGTSRDPVEGDADHEAAGVDRLHWENPPGPTVELDGDAARPAGTERSDDRGGR